FQHIGVSINSDGQLEHSPQLLNQPDLLRLAATYFPETEHPYTSELHPAQYAFILTLAQKITRGGMIFIDYGFDAAQYYHPQRDEGTLIA
ncbi:SAM-dependent methyltransferase, partial [Limosilactobacillus reuteri]|nr:SAM-dependent methyltransferase [Limosilactobacillus reuteri]